MKKHEPGRMTEDRMGDILRKAGVAVVTGALTMALCPLSALAETSTTTSNTAPTSTTQAAPGDGGTPGEPPSGGMGGGGMGGGGGADTQTFDYSGSYSGALTTDGTSATSSSESYDASTADENAVLVENGGTLTMTGGTLTKSGDDSNGDNCNFYGLNSILLSVGEGSQATVSGTSLSATSEGSNGIFATDSGTVYANDDTITTTADNSRGLDATYDGTIVANGMTISTQGNHCAGIATDRGGGNISVTDSTLSTAGSGSPLLYSTGDIEVSGVTGTASGSQIAGMEGLNTILINDSTLESTNDAISGSDPIENGVIIYQSTSGDAESTTGEAATFQASGSTLKSAITSGAMFYFTNTSANVVLSDTTLDYDSTDANLIYAAGNDSNSWGTAGSNGATVSFTGIGEDMSGDVVADTISSVDLYLTAGTTWTGAASIEENANGSTSEAPLSVNVDGTSSWVVDGDSTVTDLTVADGGKVVDASGNTVTIVANGSTVVEGTSSYTVTVTGSYSTSYDASGAGTLSTDLVDRSAFDEAFGTDTSFEMGQASDTTASTSTTDTTTSESSSAAATSTTETTSSENPFQAFLDWFFGLFS